MAFATVSEDKEESKKSGKKKEITCFRCKKVGHFASECDEELPSKTPKSGSNMLIMESSTEQEDDTDDKDGQYYEIKKSKMPSKKIIRAMNKTTMTPQLLIPNMKKMMKANSMTRTTKA